MLEKTIFMGQLFDFYGGLLTPRQARIVSLYYLENHSLAEIGENLGVSRQAVYDHLQRAEKALFEYEEKLGLVKRDRKLKKGLEEIKISLESGENPDLRKLLEMIKGLEKI